VDVSIPVLSLDVRRALARLNLSSVFKQRFMLVQSKRPVSQILGASMKLPLNQSAPFPNHKFDFGDCVYIPALDESGVVKGIWNREQEWRYSISDESCLPAAWWDETELEPACPGCLKKWDQASDCLHCGFSPERLT